MLNRAKVFRRLSQFVPKHDPPDTTDLEKFHIFLENNSNIFILTGAGVSTESGIPDYRSEDVGVFSSSSYKPVQYSDFVNKPDARTRYWARNFVGWPRFSAFQPNKVHFFIAELQGTGNKISCLVTQNVDGLHSKAGSPEIVELHGNAYWVKCIQCGDIMSRFDFQAILEKHNPFIKISSSEIRPDGDVELNQEEIKNFKVPNCEKCEGILKPTVVFFGENIPEKRVKYVNDLVDKCDAMLILGTTLSTLSSYRIVEKAYDLCKQLCLVNIGPTRGDHLADIRIYAKISDLIVEDKTVYF